MEEEGFIRLRSAVAPSPLFRRRERRRLLHAPLLFFIRLDADTAAVAPLLIFGELLCSSCNCLLIYHLTHCVGSI